ncbi:hypothetical protein QBC35DRAFT_495012 [Podospora australis]|uniref:Mid2 domain-containing protein n=1 Tax=Podospora australis TaxID=1536484 RepID=A0AAN7AKI8_9PEZI|nr:hypothetical protein QBC35DRAFT_495012 [Podospora australis]
MSLNLILHLLAFFMASLDCHAAMLYTPYTDLKAANPTTFSSVFSPPCKLRDSEGRRMGHSFELRQATDDDPDVISSLTSQVGGLISSLTGEVLPQATSLVGGGINSVTGGIAPAVSSQVGGALNSASGAAATATNWIGDTGNQTVSEASNWLNRDTNGLSNKGLLAIVIAVPLIAVILFLWLVIRCYRRWQRGKKRGTVVNVRA